MDIILDGINGKVQFIINDKQNHEYTMNDSDLSKFYVVDFVEANQRCYLSLRKYGVH